jgi:uncharacterized membrane protein
MRNKQISIIVLFTISTLLLVLAIFEHNRIVSVLMAILVVMLAAAFLIENQNGGENGKRDRRS